MNSLEKKMLAILESLKANNGAEYVRAEFEAEGLRVEELLRLKDVSLRSGLGLSLKIGGCEGMRDLLESKMLGADTIVAPMIESAFALHKYEQAAFKVYNDDERKYTQFWFNLETKSAVSSAEEILSSPSVAKMGAAVIERVDLCFSLDKGQDNVDDADITEAVIRLATLAKSNSVKVVLGGGISLRSWSLIDSLVESGLLDYYETRKIGFTTKGLSRDRYTRGLFLAIAFEIFFLKNKIQNAQNSAEHDMKRLGYLEMNYWNDIKKILPDLI
jgi:4-hydroxy-2-oxoheptanedioate aldolase